jgi:hypothetical protein
MMQAAQGLINDRPWGLTLSVGAPRASVDITLTMAKGLRSC